MTARRTAGLTLLLGVMLVAAACGSSGATTAPTEQPVASLPTASQLIPGFSFSLPSFTADTELEALFPDQIGGADVTVVSMSGADFLGSGIAGGEISPVLTQLGKTPADLSVASGGTPQLSIIAFKIKGVPADQFFTAYSQLATSGAAVTDASFGGKSVKKVAATDSPAPLFIYLKDDVIWTVTGGVSAPSDALLNEAFSKLP